MSAQAVISPAESEILASLRRRLGLHAPANLFSLGHLELLALPKTALFCSARCPGAVILRAYDQVAQWRDAGRCVISGFHSPIEKECLRILLRGSQPIIICPARSLDRFRVPPEWRTPLAQSRLLLLSPFDAPVRRPTLETAQRRNELVAALADEVCLIYATPGGRLDRLANRTAAWRSMPACETNRRGSLSQE